MPLRRILQITPWPLRRRLLAGVHRQVLPRLAPERRLRTARLLVPLGAPPRLIQPTPTAPTMRVHSPQGRVTARRVATATPWGVRRENLDLVVSALEQAGIEWFRVPVDSFTNTALAVPELDRPGVLRLLETLQMTTGGLVEVVAAGNRASSGRARRSARILRFSRPTTDLGGSLLLGAEYGCEIEFWREADGYLLGPRSNPVADVVALAEPVAMAPERVFGAFCPPSDSGEYRTRAVFTLVSPDRISFPIDVVYTWVDGADPAWRARKARALAENGWVGGVSEQATNDSRFASRDELRYSLRALHAFAPWIRQIFLVTDDQVPAWLNTEQPGVTVLGHREIFGDSGLLPTFNSQAIESRLHRIEGLSEHFLYLNDDVFLGRPVPPEMFFTPGGLTRFFPSTALVDSTPRLPSDAPANSAGKNNRRLIQETFGRVLTRKMKHTPHPSRRGVLAELEMRFAEQVTATASHQFRHPDDIAMLSSLQQYYAYLTGRAAPGEISYLYTDLADSSTPFRLARLLRDRHLDAFCLNDTDSDPAAAAEQAALLAEFLPAFLPFASPYELTQPRSATTPIPRSGPRSTREDPTVVIQQATRSVAARSSRSTRRAPLST